MLRALSALALALCSPLLARAQPSGEQGAEASLTAPAEASVETPPEPVPSSESASRGVPDRGRLTRGAPLEETPHLFVRASRRNARYGTAELVGLIQRVAAAVSELHPGPKLVVGDLSRPSGGRSPPHRSHQSGRDVDIGFYLVDMAGNPTQPDRFVSLRRDGCGRIGEEQLCFDAMRNWALLASLVSDEATVVQYVLIAPDLRRRVLEEGARQGAPADLVARVGLVTEPHSGSHSHRSHFHVRIYCPIDDRPACIDEPPYHAWYQGAPSPPTPAIRGMRTRQRRAQARAAARQRARAAARQRATRARVRARARPRAVSAPPTD